MPATTPRKVGKPTTPAAQLAGFIAKFDPVNQRMIRAVRARLRKRLPTANEMVYDNYNFFVIGYGPNDRPSDAILSLVADANGVGICYIQGARLPDPGRILKGSGNQVRSLRLSSAADLRKPAVEAVTAAAIRHSRVPFPSSGKGTLVIRSISKKQRPRRKDAK